MQITDTLISQFIANECTKQEAAFVASYLDEHPGVLEAYLQKAWNDAGEEGPLEKQQYEQMLKEIKANLFGRRIFFRQRHIKWIGVAATVLLVVGYWGFSRTEKQNNPVAAQHIAIPTAAPAEKWVTKFNTTSKSLAITLADQSEVILSPGASLHYTETFTGDKRDVYLKGEAFFEVAKDKTRPFTVYAELFTTTALGTSFRVTESSDHCQVKLYTGKVVIRNRKAGIVGWNKEVFLTPGQQMLYEINKGAVSVTSFSQNENSNTANGKTKVKTINNAALVFTNTELATVLDQLAEHYQQSIDYNKNETDGMYFTGSVLKTDSLPVILKAIARMNGLIISTKADGFLITKTR